MRNLVKVVAMFVVSAPLALVGCVSSDGSVDEADQAIQDDAADVKVQGAEIPTLQGGKGEELPPAVGLQPPPIGEKSGMQGGCTSGFAAPGYQAPTIPAPNYPAPSFGAPGYSPPIYHAPNYQSPTYQQPSLLPGVSAPTYTAPHYPGPVFAAPIYEAPTYEAPIFPAPVYMAPTYQPPNPLLPANPMPTVCVPGAGFLQVNPGQGTAVVQGRP